MSPDEAVQESVPLGYDEFLRVDVRVGTIIKADAFPEARQPAFKLVVDFGAEIGIRKTSAQITVHYSLENLPGRQVAAVMNLPPKQIGKFMSQILVLGFPDENGDIVLLEPDRSIPNGGRMA